MSNIAIVLLRMSPDLEMFMVVQKHYSYDCPDCKNNSCNKHLEYTNPAGNILKGENNKDAAIREFLEETGQQLPEIDMSNMKIFEECDTIIIVSLLKETTLVSKKVDSDEIDSVEWVKLVDIPKLKLRDIFKRLYSSYITIWESMGNVKTD